MEHHIEAPSRRSRSANVAWLIIVVALFLILPMLQVLLKREIGSSVSEPVPEFSEEQAIEPTAMPTTTCARSYPPGAPTGTATCRRAVRRGAGPARGHLHGQVRRGRHVHGDALVNDACGVEIYEDLSAYDAADSELDDVPLPAGTVLFLSGNNALYFHSSNAQVDDLSTDTAPNR